MRNSIGLLLQDCMDPLALLSHVNSSLEQTCRYNIAYCLDNQYHALRKNVPSESESLFGGELPKRIMNITTNKLFSMSSKPHNTSFKTSKNFPQIPRNRTQNGYQRNHSGQYQKFYSNGFKNFIVNELHQDVWNFHAGNLKYFSKNWYKYTKDKYILNIVTNGPKLELNELPCPVFLTHVGIRQMQMRLPTWKAKSLYHVSTFLPTWFIVPLKNCKDIFRYICFTLYLQQTVNNWESTIVFINRHCLSCFFISY